MFQEPPKLKSIFFTGFLMSLHLALTAYVNSSFLSEYFSEKTVGLLFTFGSIAAIIAFLLIPRALRRLGGYKFLLGAVASSAILLFLLSIEKSAWVIVPAFVLYITFNNIIIFSLDELVEIFSKNSRVGKIRGLYLAIASSAWVVAQIILGKILGNFSFRVVYFISFEIMTFLLIFAFFFLRKIPDPKYDRARILGFVKKFFKNKNLARSYKINFLLQFFYAWMVIYTPIYLSSHLGFTWKEIAMIFTIMLTPFVFMPIPLGKYADKIGERKMLMFGFAIASLATFSIFFIKLHAVWLWALLLFTSRIGAATIEVMSDVYFFKHIDPENDEFIGLYRNTMPVAYVLAPLLAFLVFSFTPSFNYIYIILGGIMLYGVYLASTIRKGDI